MQFRLTNYPVRPFGVHPFRFNVSEIIFTGVSGAISSELNVGDIVIGKRLIQHDLDGRPLMEEYGIPFTVLRIISDTADEKSHIDFPAFIEKVSNKYSIEIIKNIFSPLQ